MGFFIYSWGGLFLGIFMLVAVMWQESPKDWLDSTLFKWSFVLIGCGIWAIIQGPSNGFAMLIH